VKLQISLFLFGFVFSQTAPVYAVNENPKKVRLNDSKSMSELTLGDVVTLSEDGSWTLKNDFNDGQGIKNDGLTDWYSQTPPSVTYSIEIILRSDAHFLVKIGVEVLTQVTRFRIDGLPDGTQFVTELHSGGSKFQAFSYINTQHQIMPKASREEFKDTSEGIAAFRTRLHNLLAEYEPIFTLESTEFGADEAPRVREGAIITNALPAPEKAPHSVAGAFKALLTKLLLIPVVTETAWLTQGSLNALTEYVVLFMRSNKSQPQIFWVDTFKAPSGPMTFVTCEV
jgi:hypothetical protein